MVRVPKKSNISNDRLTGFRNRQQRVWRLLHLGVSLGLLTGVVRCVEMRQRLYPALHEAFYVYLLVFFVGLVITLRVSERWPVTILAKKPNLSQ
jgi:hypothetical protein